MIRSFEGNSLIGPDLRPEFLEPYWAEYHAFRDEAPELHQITENELLALIDQEKAKSRPHVDSQQAISQVLTNLGSQHNFHRQFNEQFPGYRPNQILGMQLYALLARDEETWTYMKTQHAGHAFSHSTYFISQA